MSSNKRGKPVRAGPVRAATTRKHTAGNLDSPKTEDSSRYGGESRVGGSDTGSDSGEIGYGTSVPAETSIIRQLGAFIQKWKPVLALGSLVIFVAAVTSYYWTLDNDIKNAQNSIDEVKIDVKVNEKNLRQLNDQHLVIRENLNHLTGDVKENKNSIDTLERDLKAVEIKQAGARTDTPTSD